MWKSVLAVLFVVTVRPIFGQEARAAASVYAIPAMPALPALPAVVVPPVAAADPSCGRTDAMLLPAGTTVAAAAPASAPLPHVFLSKADHLRIAAEHLDSAGMPDEAERFRKLEAAEERAHRGAETAKIFVHIQMLEFSPKELSKLDSQCYSGSKGTSVMELIAKLQKASSPPGPSDNVLRLPAPIGGSPAQVAISGPTFRSLIKALCKDRNIRVRADPDLIVTSGRPTYILEGGEIGYRTKDAEGKDVIGFKEYGTRVDLLAVRLSGDRIHLDCRLRLSEVDKENSINGIPALKSREVETGVEVRSGETIAIGGLIESRGRVVPARPAASDKPEKSGDRKEAHRVTEEIESLFMVTAEIVTASSAATAKAKSAVER
jgi:hypothetical protein